MKKMYFVIAVLILMSLISITTAADKGYHLLAKIPVSGNGGWDALAANPTASRVYVSHSDKVDIIDSNTNKVVGKITGLSGVHGIAIAEDLNHGFITNGKTAKVTIFDLKTLQKLGNVDSGKNPDAILYEPTTHAVFSFNGKSNDATVIAAATGTVLATIKLNGKPEFAVADDRGHVYVNLEDKDSVLMIDANNLQVKKQWSVAPAKEPSGIAMDVKNKRLFICGGNQKLVILNSDTGRRIASFPIGNHVDGTAFDPELGLIFSSNGDGTLTVIHQESKDKYTLLAPVKTQLGARTIALDTKNHKVFLPVADFGKTPAPDAQHPHPHQNIISGSFKVLVFGQ